MMRTYIIFTFVIVSLAVTLAIAWSDISFEKTPMNVVLISSDTTRSESMPPYGNPIARMPNLCDMVKQGAQIQYHYSVGTSTLPGHASMLTGLYPDRHGVRTNKHLLSDHFTTLTRIFKSQGYKTGAVVSVSILKELTRDFDHVFYPDQRTFWVRSGQQVGRVDQFLNLCRNEETPFFLWIHSFDPHCPYAPPEPREEIFSEVANGQEFIDFMDPNVPRPTGYSPESPRFSILAQYYGELHYWDGVLGEILTELKAFSNTSVAFVSDHGENLGEGGQYGHIWVTEEVLRSPMIFWHSNKDKIMPGNLISGIGQQTDVLPTLTALAGIPAPMNTDGINLAPYLMNKRRKMPKRLAYSIGYGAATVTDPFHGVKIRKRLTSTQKIPLNQLKPEISDYFEDNILSDRILEHEVDEKGFMVINHNGEVKAPDVQYLECIYRTYGFGETKLFLLEMEVGPNGKFSLKIPLDIDKGNLYRLYQEDVPFAISTGETASYSMRLLSPDKKLVWQSPWIGYKRSAYQPVPDAMKIRIIDTDRPWEIELGKEYHPNENPFLDEMTDQLTDMLHRPGGMLNQETVCRTILGTVSLPGYQEISAMESYAYFQGDRNDLKQNSFANQLRALQALGYIN